MKNEDDYLLLSQLSHAGYCLRRAALVMNEQVWKESADTAKGRLEHKNVHDRRIERREDEIRLYEFDVVSHSLMLTGKCDCVEAYRDSRGCKVPFCAFPVRLYPVEFKHGKLRDEAEYEMQLCAQAMCLEEMYQTSVFEGDIFYTSSHRRCHVQFSEVLRKRVKETAQTLKMIKTEFFLPPAEYGSKCKKCSLAELCMPRIKKSASTYCEMLEKEAREVEIK